jgi:hypothetical protein
VLSEAVSQARGTYREYDEGFRAPGG